MLLKDQANYLGVPYSLFAKVSKGTRSIPNEAHHKFIELMKMLDRADQQEIESPATLALVEKQREVLMEALEFRRLRYAYRAKVLEQKLSEIKKIYNSALRTHNVLCVVLEQNEGALTSLQSAYFNVFRKKAEAVLEKNSLTRQMEISREIAGIQHQLSIVNDQSSMVND